MYDFYKDVMEIIFEEKTKLGSFRELCEPLGIPVTTIQKWFKDSGSKPRSPNFIDVSKIMDSLGMTVCKRSDLLGITANKESVMMYNEMLRRTAKGSVEDADSLRNIIEKLSKENQELKMKNASLQGQNDLLKEMVFVPMSSKTAN